MRFFAQRVEHGAGLRRFAGERPFGRLEQVLQQLALPGIPDLRAGAADVGHGQQIQGRQVALVADALGKGADDIRVAQVFLLRDAAHREVFMHQEFDQPGVILSDAMLAAETAHLDGTQLGMVAAAPLRNVVEQGGDVQHPRLVPARGQLRAEGIFVRMLGDEEAAHVAQHHQDVLVHRVDVKQIVLHLAHDAPEHPQVAPQHRGLVHQPHGVRDAGGLLQDAQEGAAVDRIVPEGGIHDGAHVVQRAQGSR